MVTLTEEIFPERILGKSVSIFDSGLATPDFSAI